MISKLKTKFTAGAWIKDVKDIFNKVNEIIESLTPSPSVYAVTPNIEIKTKGSKTLVTLNDIVEIDLAITLANPGEQRIGDILVFATKPNSTEDDITYTYNSDYFYMTQCGGPQDPVESTFSEGIQERDVTIFTFDGEKFCATYDNC